MKRYFVLALMIFISACKNKKGPDVSGIPVDISIHRFDRFLFEQVDTSNLAPAMSQAQKEYGFFAADFFNNILGLPFPEGKANDSSDHAAFSELKRFLRITRPLYDSLAPKFKETGNLEKE